MTGNNPRLIRTELTLMCGLFIVSLVLRLALIYPTQFDGLYGQDAYAYYDYAQDLRTSLQTDTALKPFFWPLGYPTLLAVGLSIAGTTPPVAQAVSILMGAALTSLVYVIARQIGINRLGSITAAAVMTVCGQALQSSIVVMSDIPALFWAALSAIFLLHYLIPNARSKNDRALWLLLTVITLSFASLTRWIYLVLSLPFSIAVLVEWRGRIKWRVTAFAFLAAALIFFPQFLFSHTSPFPTLDHPWVEGWSPANAFKQSFTTIDGHFDYEKINAIYYAQPYYDPYYLSPLFTAFGLIGLWAMMRRKAWLLILFGGWALLPYLFLAGIPYQNIRFPLIVFPAGAVLVGSGINVVMSGLRHVHFRRFKLRYARWLIVLVVLLGLGQVWRSAAMLVTKFINNQQQDKLAAIWVSEKLPAGATIYSFGLTLTLQHYTTLNVNELYYETPQTLAQKWQRGHDEYLVLNGWNIENQWAGRNPQINYHWLRDQRGLTRLGKFGNYTLFKIRG